MFFIQAVFGLLLSSVLVSGQGYGYGGSVPQPAPAPIQVAIQPQVEPLAPAPQPIQPIARQTGAPSAIPPEFQQQFQPQQPVVAPVPAPIAVAQEQPQQPVLDCAGRPDGVYVLSQRHCTNKFWKCANGISYEYFCPADLVFSVEDLRCEYRSQVPACGGTRPVPPPPEAVQQQQPTVPVVVDFDCANKADGNYVKRPCDADFYTCAASVATKLSCPAGTGFDVVDQQCEHISECGKPKVNQQQVPVQQGPAPVAVQSQQDLSGYGAPVVAPVAVQTPVAPPQYSQPAPAPVAVQQPAPTQAPVVVIDPYSAPAPVAVQQPVATTQAPVDFDCATRADGYYFKKQCDSVFYSCSGGIAVRFVCPSGTAFDAVDQACEYIDICGQPKTTPAPIPVPAPIAVQQPIVDPYSAPAPVAVQQPAYAATVPPTTTTAAPAPAPVAVQQPAPYTAPAPAPVAVQQPAPYSAPAPAPVAVQKPAPVAVQQPAPYSAPAPAPVAVQQPAPYSAPAPAPVAVQQPVATTQASVDFDCSTRADGYYFKKQCDSTFYSCSGGAAYRLSCPAGTGFDSNDRTCEHLSECGQPKATTQAPAPAPVAVQEPLSQAYRHRRRL